MVDWQHKVVVITGGSAGLGRALAEAWARAGARLVLAARDPARLEATAAELRQHGGQVLPVATDLTRPHTADALVADALTHYGRLDVLVNCAGRSSRGAALTTPVAEFQMLWELNFLALVRCCQAAAPHLVKTGGHLVNIASLAAKSAGRYLGAYPASKFPVAAFTQQLRDELRTQGVHVLLVCPGPIARPDAGQRYDQTALDLPESARRPGGGVALEGIPPDRLAQKILAACARRRPELVLPGTARLVFAIAQLWPTLGDWILRRALR